MSSTKVSISSWSICPSQLYITGFTSLLLLCAWWGVLRIRTYSILYLMRFYCRTISKLFTSNPTHEILSIKVRKWLKSEGAHQERKPFFLKSLYITRINYIDINIIRKRCMKNQNANELSLLTKNKSFFSWCTYYQ